MEQDVQKQVNLADAMRERVPSGGWDAVAKVAGKNKRWTPELFRAALKEYFDFCDGSPLTKDVKLSSKVSGSADGEGGGGDTQDTQRQTVRPYVMKSLISRVGISDWDRFKAKYCNETTDEGREFTELCAAVENFVGGSLQEGAVAGIYNAKMVMGLTDVAEHVKQEVSGYQDKTDEELMAEIERLKKATSGD